MISRSSRWFPLVVLVVSAAALIVSIVWALGSGPSWPGSGATPMMPGYGMPMMPGQSGMVPSAPGTGPVRDLADASGRAQPFADERGLQVGEVMQFSNGYYAELVDSAGRGATEVLIDPTSGAVQLEWGPAMMWNTAYGMMPTSPRPGSAPIGPDEALRVADQWLQQSGTGLHATDATAFPGYYTLHTLRGDQTVGMLSVHAQTGNVWYHTWHGRFIAMQEHPSPAGAP
jgi:hypothetical protein